MLFYILLLLILTTFGYLLCNKTSLKYKEEIFMVVVFLVLTTLSAIRYEVGYDYSYTYAPSWQKLLNTPLNKIGSLRHEKGFVLLELLLMQFTKNFHAIFVATSIIIGLLYCIYIYKYSTNKTLSIFLFYSLGFYYCSMNFIRQTIAAFIFAFAVEFIKKKKILPFMILTLFAATFHKSALIMIPMYFILQIKITKRVLSFYLAVTAVIFLSSKTILGIVTKYYYKSYSENSIYLTQGIEWYDALVPLIIFALLFIFQDEICRKNKRNYIYVSCSYFSLFFYIIAINHFILDRFSMYFDLSIVIGLTILLTVFKEAKNTTAPAYKQKMNKAYWVVLSTIIISVSFVNYRQLAYDGHYVIPYQTIFGSDEYKLYYSTLQAGDTEYDDEPIRIDLSKT